MYYKIALSNVKKSFKDYAIYFLTLSFAVCIFYSFNSIEAQKAFIELGKSQNKIMQSMMSIIDIVSVFVSIILGCLIIYANNFLIKKRKKEFGIYLTLGMPKKKISIILFMETFLVGILSLVVGLAIGIFISQGLSAFTIKMFQIDMSAYKFVFSIKALIKTSLYFAIIFILVMIFNSFMISKYKLIDMINASRKNEEMKIKKNAVSFIIFILGIAFIATECYLVKITGRDMQSKNLKIAAALAIISIFLIFYGLSGLCINLIKKNRKVYFKNLNIFVARQIYSKINTNFISMSIICIMLSLTVIVLSTGLSFKQILENSLRENTSFDASARMYIDNKTPVKSIEDAFKKMNVTFKDNVECRYLNVYGLNTPVEDIIGKYADDKKDVSDYKYTPAIRISDYNNMQKLRGEKTIDLKDNQVIVTSNHGTMSSAADKMVNSGDSIILRNEKFTIANKEVMHELYYTAFVNYNYFTLIVPDKLTDGCDVIESVVNMEYKGDKEKTEEEYVKLLRDITLSRNSYKLDGVYISGDTRERVIESNKGFYTTLLFVGVYLGIIFLLASAAVLALQQLSEASDSSERYVSLKRIGASKSMINKSIFIQILIYFIFPLILSIVHSVIAILYISDYLNSFGKGYILPSALFTAGVITLIYGGYFYVTYNGYKAVVKGYNHN